MIIWIFLPVLEHCSILLYPWRIASFRIVDFDHLPWDSLRLRLRRLRSSSFQLAMNSERLEDFLHRQWRPWLSGCGGRRLRFLVRIGEPHLCLGFRGGKTSSAESQDCCARCVVLLYLLCQVCFLSGFSRKICCRFFLSLFIVRLLQEKCCFFQQRRLFRPIRAIQNMPGMNFGNSHDNNIQM